MSNDAPERCYHCGLPVPPEAAVAAEVGGAARRFCCNGCRSVCEAIHRAGLEGFYKRTPEGEILGPPPEPPKELALYDLEEVQSEFVQDLGEGREVNLLVEGIHCAACVWLIERALDETPGVQEARVNLTGKRLRLRWDDARVHLSTLLRRLADLGYAATPFDPEAAEGAVRRQNRALLFRMAFAGFAMMNLLWISIALYSGAERGGFRSLFYWVGFAIATPTLAYSGLPFFRAAWSGLRHASLTMDLPIAIGATITYAYSVYVTLTLAPGHEVYYDTLVNFLFVILVGRFLESVSKREAVSATQRLLDLQPRVATRLDDSGEHLVPIRAVRPGDLVLVRPGERVPADGEIVQGETRVDESMLTGESEPQPKGPGDGLTAGTLNGDGAVRLRVAGTLKDTALGRIIRLVEEAQASKAPIQCIADRVVPWFVAVTLGLAAVTFLWWWGEDFEKALMAATSVLIITCPCAFGLATPMAIAVASGLGARHGILVKNGAVLEGLSDIRHFVFDKTGTLTEGKVRVVGVRSIHGDWHGEGPLPDGLGAVLAPLASAERGSEHPLAGALVSLAGDLGLESPPPAWVRAHPGRGIEAEVAGHRLLAGRGDWLRAQGVVPAPGLEVPGDAAGFRVALDGREQAFVQVEDPLRPGARELMDALRADGVRLTLLSGDRRAVAEAVAARLGGMEVIAEVLPEDKERVIAGLQADGHRVAMVGDGINDAPGLVRADVGIAMGSGTDVSIASADLVLISSELDRVRLALALSRRSLRTIRQNIGLSILYNTVMVPLAMSALVTPLVAAISMPVSSLAVIGNSARLRTLFKGARRSPQPPVER